MTFLEVLTFLIEFSVKVQKFLQKYILSCVLFNYIYNHMLLIKKKTALRAVK